MAGPASDGRPLVVRCGALGDMVLITALIRDLHARYRRPIDVLTSGAWSEPLLRGQPGVGDVLSVRSRKTPYWLSIDQRRVVRQLRARGPGPTWFCDGNPAARPLLERAGVEAGFVVDAQDHPLRPGEHATEQWARLARIDPRLPARGASAAAPIEIGAAHGGCRLEVTSDERADVDRWLAGRRLEVPFIAFQIGNKRTMRRGLRRLAVNHKHWPVERWTAVMRHVRMRCPGHAIVLLGAPAEYRLNQELAARAAVDGVCNAADDLPVRRLVALLSRAAALVTVDSGPAHVGAAVGCPQVVLFGRASPTLYRPWGSAGSDVKLLTGVEAGQPSMRGISAAEVTAAWDALSLRAT